LVSPKADNDPKTVADKKSALTNSLVAQQGDLPLVSLDQRTVMKLLDGLSDRPALRRVSFAYLRQFLNPCIASEKRTAAANTPCYQ